MYFVTRFEFYVQTSKHIVEPTSVPYRRLHTSVEKVYTFVG